MPVCNTPLLWPDWCIAESGGREGDRESSKSHKLSYFLTNISFFLYESYLHVRISSSHLSCCGQSNNASSNNHQIILKSTTTTVAGGRTVVNKYITSSVIAIGLYPSARQGSGIDSYVHALIFASCERKSCRAVILFHLLQTMLEAMCVCTAVVSFSSNSRVLGYLVTLMTFNL